MSMNKKSGGLGRFLAFATVAGAVAAGISYFAKYKSFHKELEEDFHDFEDDGDGSDVDSTMNRNYVALHADKDEFKVAASDMADAARDAAGAAKSMVRDAASIVTDTAREAAEAASDTAQSMFNAAREKVSSSRESSGQPADAEPAGCIAASGGGTDATTIIEEDSEL